MNYDHEKKPKPGRVREPVQVYLERSDSELLERLTQQLETTKSDVLRQALSALERELSDPENHPALRIIGIAGDPSTWTGKDPGYDVGLEHDRYLAETEIARWDRTDDPEER